MPEPAQPYTQSAQPDPQTDPRDQDWEPLPTPTTQPTTPAPPIVEPPPFPGGGEES